MCCRRGRPAESRSVVVAGAADVDVERQRRLSGFGLDGLTVQVVFENRRHAFVRAGPHPKCPGASRFDALIFVVPVEMEDAQTSFKALLRVGAPVHDFLHQLRCGGSPRFFPPPPPPPPPPSPGSACPPASPWPWLASTP